MTSPLQQFKCFPGKGEEIMKNYIYWYINAFKTPLKIQDIDLNIQYSSSVNRSFPYFVIRNKTYNPELNTLKYQRVWRDEFDKVTDQPYSVLNEFTGKNYADWDRNYNSIAQIQMYQLNLLTFNKEKKLENAIQSFEDYTIYFTIARENLSAKSLEDFIEIHDKLPSIIKKTNLVVFVENGYFDELKLLGFMQQMQIDNEELFKKLHSRFTLYYSKREKEDEMLSFIYSKLYESSKNGFIVNKEGKTIKRFTVENVQNAINRVLAFEERLTPLSKDELDFLKYFSKFNKIMNELNYKAYALYEIKIRAVPSEDLSSCIPLYIKSISISVRLMDRDLEKIKYFKSVLKDKHYKKFNIEYTEIPSFTIDLSTWTESKCANPSCNTILTKKDKFYYCYWCKIFYCEKCVEDTFNKETQNLREKFIHKEHHLLYISTTEQKVLTDMTKKHLGRNMIQHYDDNELTQTPNVNCNGCSKKIIDMPRYICISCMPGYETDFINYCYNCFEHLRKNDEIGQTIEKIVINDSSPTNVPKHHCHNKHIYICVIAGSEYATY